METQQERTERECIKFDALCQLKEEFIKCGFPNNMTLEDVELNAPHMVYELKKMFLYLQEHIPKIDNLIKQIK